jgi:cell division septation protein DedD
MRPYAYRAQARASAFVYVLMLVIALAFGGFVWQLYSTPEVTRISAPDDPFKIAGPAAASAETETGTPESFAAEAGSASAPVHGTRSSPPTAPGGAYVVQLAALQSEAAIEPAWRRLASRAPDLFASAQMDVERADLGPRGVYYRVRAGYFSDRDSASQFCDRIRQMGQDCIISAR